MVKFFAHTHTYDEPWQTVSLAFFLRYPNPYAAHVLSADVLSRSFTPHGTLVTSRLILKKGPIPKWLPHSVVGRGESWIVEESEVDPLGKIVRCETRNLDHVRVLSVRESVELREGDTAGSTTQRTEAKLVSQLGWLARRAERYGHEKFQRNLERSRAGLHLVVDLLRQSREQALAIKLMHDEGLGYQLPPLVVQGTALETFRPRLFHPTSTPPSTSASHTGGESARAGTADAADAAKSHDPKPQQRQSLRTWFWRSPGSPTPPPPTSASAA